MRPILLLNFISGGRKMVSFNIPPYVGNEFEYMKQAVENLKICGDGDFTKKCNAWMEEKFPSAAAAGADNTLLAVAIATAKKFQGK